VSSGFNQICRPTMSEAEWVALAELVERVGDAEADALAELGTMLSQDAQEQSTASDSPKIGPLAELAARLVDVRLDSWLACRTAPESPPRADGGDGLSAAEKETLWLPANQMPIPKLQAVRDAHAAFIDHLKKIARQYGAGQDVDALERLEKKLLREIFKAGACAPGIGDFLKAVVAALWHFPPKTVKESSFEPSVNGTAWANPCVTWTYKTVPSLMATKGVISHAQKSALAANTIFFDRIALKMDSNIAKQVRGLKKKAAEGPLREQVMADSAGVSLDDFVQVQVHWTAVVEAYLKYKSDTMGGQFVISTHGGPARSWKVVPTGCVVLPQVPPCLVRVAAPSPSPSPFPSPVPLHLTLTSPTSCCCAGTRTQICQHYSTAHAGGS
jgi:hypothetical protein